jgi:hypothetical protein
MTLEITTSGASCELPIFLDGDQSNMYHAWTQRELTKANWMADPSRKEGLIRISGVRTKDGKADAVKTLRVGKTKLRVYGGVWADQFYSATKGSIESPDLTKDELPKVTVAGKNS